MMLICFVVLLTLNSFLVESCGSGTGAPQTNPTFTLSVARNPPWLTIGNAEGSVQYALQRALQDEGIAGGQFNYQIVVVETQVEATTAAGGTTQAPRDWAQYSGTVKVTGTAPSGFWNRLAHETQGYLVDSNNQGSTSMKVLTTVTIT